jgi:voltage-gated potassium channel
MGRWVDLAVFASIVATVPTTVLHLALGESPTLTVADWALWMVFVADFASELIRRGVGSLTTRRGIIGLVVSALSLPGLPPLLALLRLARLAAFDTAPESP